MAENTGHNSQVSSQELLSFLERVERLTEEKKALQDDIKMVFAEAKSSGYDVVVMRAILKRRAAKPHDVQEFDAMMDLYQSALGMSMDMPLFRYFDGLGDVVGDEAIIKALGPVVAPGGEMIVKNGSAAIRLWRDTKGNLFNEPYVAPQPKSSSSSCAPSDEIRPRAAPPPDVDEVGAEALGRAAWRENQPITANPFPWDDKRRGRFDAGWRMESGTDGMGDD